MLTQVAVWTLAVLVGGGQAGVVPVGLEVAVASDDQVIRDVHRSSHGERAYRLYLPSGHTPGEGTPLLVLLHGCTQDADDLARGTRMDTLAGERGVAVLYPEQAPDAHPMRCWNWYEPAHHERGSGEVALLAGMIEEVLEARGLDPARVYVAGISAGGAMAAVLAANHPELIAGVASHSGVPFGAARGLAEAGAVLGGQAEPPAGKLARAVEEAMGDRARLLPLLVIHGEGDDIVSPRNARAFEAQWAELIRSLTGSEAVGKVRSAPAGAAWDGEVVRLQDREGHGWFVAYRVEDLGHAWSGGSPEGTFTREGGLDASRLILDFFLGEGS